MLLASSNNHEKNFNTNGTKNGRNQVAFSNKKKQYMYVYLGGWGKLVLHEDHNLYHTSKHCPFLIL